MVRWISDHSLVILTGSLLVVQLLVGYTAFIDGSLIRKPATIALQPTEGGCVTHLTTKRVYKKGEVVEAVVEIDKLRQVTSTIQWNLMDARFYPYAARPGAVPVGKHILQVPIERIPTHIPTGEYYFSGVVKYEVNPLNDVFLPLKTNKFQVVE
jgi:hypothetical protein